MLEPEIRLCLGGTALVDICPKNCAWDSLALPDKFVLDAGGIATELEAERALITMLGSLREKEEPKLLLLPTLLPPPMGPAPAPPLAEKDLVRGAGLYFNTEGYGSSCMSSFTGIPQRFRNSTISFLYPII